MLRKSVLILPLLFASPVIASESYPIQGKPNCTDFDKIVKVMSEGGAKPFMYVLSEDGKFLTVFFGNEKTTEWVAIIRAADSKNGCFMDAGIGFGVIPEYRGPGI